MIRRLAWICLLAAFVVLCSLRADAQIGKCGDFNGPCWTTASRPTNTINALGWNRDLSVIEFFNGTTWQSLNSGGSVSVDQFRLATDPDDNLAFTRGLAWSAANSGCLLLTAGRTYTVTIVTLISNTCIVGPGKDKATVKQKAGTNGATFVLVGTTVGTTLVGFTIDGNKSNGAAVIGLVYSGTWSKTLVDDVRITNCSADGFRIVGVAADGTNNTESFIRNSRIDNNSAHGINIAVGSFLTVQNNLIDNNTGAGFRLTDVGVPQANPYVVLVNNLKLVGNTVINNGQQGVTIGNFNKGVGVWGSLSGPGPQASNVIIANNEFAYNVGNGLEADGQFQTITGNNIHDNTGNGMLFNATDSILVGNDIYNNASYGIDAGGSYRSKFSSNRIYNNSASSGSGVNFGSALDLEFIDNQVFGNGNNQLAAGTSDNGNCIGGPCAYSLTGLPQQTGRLVIHNNRITLTSSHVAVSMIQAVNASLRDNTCLLGVGSAGDSDADKCYQIQSSNVDNDNNKIILQSNGSMTLPIASAATAIIPDGGVDFSVTGTTAITSILTTAQNANLQKVTGIVVTAPGAMTTSVTPLTIGTGVQVLTVGAGLSFGGVNTVRIGQVSSPYVPATPINYMEGTVTSYVGTTLTVNVTVTAGSGNFSSWKVGIVADVKCTLVGGGGANAAFYANMDANGNVIGCIGTNFGTGYTSTPTCTIGGGGNSGGTCTAYVGSLNNAGRTIRLTFANAGVFVNGGGNINLASAAPYVSSTTGWLILKGDGAGNWNEVSRSGAPGNFTNMIVNPCMDIDQRFEGTVHSGTGYIADQWYLNNAAGTWTSSQRTLDTTQGNNPSPDCSSYATVTVTTQHTPAAGDANYMLQAIRGGTIRNLEWGIANAHSIVLDFCMRGSLSMTIPYFIINQNNNHHFVNTAVLVANTPKCFSAVIPPDTFTIGTDNGVSLYLGFDLGSGTTLETSTLGAWVNAIVLTTSTATKFISQANGTTLFISGIRLYPGNQDVPWAQRSYDQEFSGLQQYYRKTFPNNTVPGQLKGAADALCMQLPSLNSQPSIYWKFDPPMVKTPVVGSTLLTYNTSAANTFWRNLTAGTDLTPTVGPNSTIGLTGVQIAVTAAAAGAAADNLCIHATADADFR